MRVSMMPGKARTNRALLRQWTWGLWTCGMLCIGCGQPLSPKSPVVSSEPTSQSRIQVSQAQYRAKSVEGHVRHDFLIQSVGTEPLIINDIVSSCGCTVAKSSTTQVAPGETATVTVDLHVQPNRRESSVFVRSNDRQTPVLELKVAATDMPNRTIQFVPAVIRVPAGQSDVEVQAMVKVEQWNNSHQKLSFSDFEFQKSDNVKAVEPSRLTESKLKPLVWNETPVRSSDESVVAELTDRTVTLIPVRFQVRRVPSATPAREFVRVDLKQDLETSAILAVEVRTE